MVPSADPQLSIAFTNSCPWTTSPKTVCLPFRWGVGTVVMKNCDPLLRLLILAVKRKAKMGKAVAYVLGPEFAIDRR